MRFDDEKLKSCPLHGYIATESIHKFAVNFELDIFRFFRVNHSSTRVIGFGLAAADHVLIEIVTVKTRAPPPPLHTLPLGVRCRLC